MGCCLGADGATLIASAQSRPEGGQRDGFEQNGEPILGAVALRDTSSAVSPPARSIAGASGRQAIDAESRAILRQWLPPRSSAQCGDGPGWRWAAGRGGCCERRPDLRACPEQSWGPVGHVRPTARGTGQQPTSIRLADLPLGAINRVICRRSGGGLSSRSPLGDGLVAGKDVTEVMVLQSTSPKTTLWSVMHNTHPAPARRK